MYLQLSQSHTSEVARLIKVLQMVRLTSKDFGGILYGDQLSALQEAKKSRNKD